ncbi:MAG: hypothetical protein LBR79_02540 [Oscillospiraceae bacterium]|nr:hypothetical protein [Oscillospiraceae bacterium]
MKVFKKTVLAVGLFSLFFSGVFQSNLVSAVSDKVIQIHDKTKELADLVTDYYVEEYPAGLSSLYTFIGKLNEKQLQVFKNSFSNWGFPQFLHGGSEVSLSVSIKSINLLVAAVKSADLEFVKLVVENFYIPDINATDDCGCGSPLWCAVCLAGEKGIDDKTAKDLVDYLLSIGANPYTEDGKGYVPYLFQGSSSATRMCLKETFEKYGYHDMFKNLNDKSDFPVDKDEICPPNPYEFENDDEYLAAYRTYLQAGGTLLPNPFEFPADKTPALITAAFKIAQQHFNENLR